jgi:hypothetical protein
MLYVEYLCAKNGEPSFKMFRRCAIFGTYAFPYNSNSLISAAFWLGADAEEM